MENQLIFSGSSNIKLSESIVKKLDKKLGDISLSTFSDGEISVQINENVRGKDTFVIQSTSAPAEKNLMELILISDALKSCLLYTSPSPRDGRISRMPSSA